MTVLDELFSGDDARAAAVLEHVDAAHLPALAEALASGGADSRWWAACALARLPDARALNALLAAAIDPDPDVRAAVLQGLGEQRAPEAVAPLLFALADDSSYLARLAADALIRIGKPAVPSLIRALENDAAPHVRVHAARALALIGDIAAVPALFHALEDESAMVQHWAEEGLDRMGVGQVYFKP
ncbi:MAG TPA: HEAT repeat domain-containing protein [Anaerolineales bacterium]|nr:HEAT repeat domain-containing protein [Anaerolineales bacterium]